MGTELTHRDDSIVALSQKEITQITKDATAVVKDAVAAKDFNHILDYLGAIGRAEQASWFARAHVLYEAHKVWHKPPFEYDDDFFGFMSERMSKGAETIRRMIETWEWVIERPSHSKARLKRLFQLPPSGLWYIKQAAKEGQLGEKHWKQIETAPHKAELREIMLDVRGAYRRGKGALFLAIDPEDGTLLVSKPGQPSRPFGRLNVHMEDDDELIAAAIERTMNSAHIKRG